MERSAKPRTGVQLSPSSPLSRMPQDKRDELVRNIIDRVPFRTIRDTLGVSTSTISRHAKLLGIGRPARIKPDWSVVQASYDHGMPLRECKKKFRVSYDVIRHAIVNGELRLRKTVPVSELSLAEYATRNNGKRNPHIQTLLRKKAIAEGMPYLCRVCFISEWNDKLLTLRLDHIDGDRTNHNPGNLAFICPNCDSQQETYHYRNKGKYTNPP
jgi:hypothetical protein